VLLQPKSDRVWHRETDGSKRATEALTMAELTKTQRVFLLGFKRGHQFAGRETHSDGGL
jgi:hypothetical protein